MSAAAPSEQTPRDAETPYTAPSLRNRPAILSSLLTLSIPPSLTHALEIGSGLGAHLAINAPAFPHLTWHPTELSPARSSILSSALAPPNVVPPQALDASEDVSLWPASLLVSHGSFGLVLCVNVVHVSPWAVVRGVFAGAQAICGTGGWVVFYGPFCEDGVAAPQGSSRYHEGLRVKDAAWGVRRVGDMVVAAEDEGFVFMVKERMEVGLFYVLGFQKT